MQRAGIVPCHDGTMCLRKWLGRSQQLHGVHLGILGQPLLLVPAKCFERHCWSGVCVTIFLRDLFGERNVLGRFGRKW